MPKYMVIEKVTRTYSRSINLKSYGSSTESWVKCEATYTAQCESQDDPIKCSEMLGVQAQQDVANQINDIINKVKAANPNTVPATMAPAQTDAAPAPRPLG
jgi:hypothetical protein